MVTLPMTDELHMWESWGRVAFCFSWLSKLGLRSPLASFLPQDTETEWEPISHSGLRTLAAVWKGAR